MSQCSSAPPEDDNLGLCMQWRLLRQWKSGRSLNRQFPRHKTDSSNLNLVTICVNIRGFVCQKEQVSLAGWLERAASSRKEQGEQWGAKGILLPQLCTAPGAEMAPCESTVLPGFGEEHRAGSSAPVLLNEVTSCAILGICQSGEWVPRFLLSTLPSRIRKLRFGFLQKLKKPQTLNKTELFPASCFSSLWFSPCKHWLCSLLFTKACWRICDCYDLCSSFLKVLYIFFVLLRSCKPQQHDLILWNQRSAQVGLIFLDTFSLKSDLAWFSGCSN